MSNTKHTAMKCVVFLGCLFGLFRGSWSAEAMPINPEPGWILTAPSESCHGNCNPEGLSEPETFYCHPEALAILSTFDAMSGVMSDLGITCNVSYQTDSTDDPVYISEDSRCVYSTGVTPTDCNSVYGEEQMLCCCGTNADACVISPPPDVGGPVNVTTISGAATTTTTTPVPADTDSPMSAATVAGIVVGAVIGVGVLAAVAYKCTRTKAKSTLEDGWMPLD